MRLNNSIFRYFLRATSFQVLSDLHLEVGQQYSSFDIPTSAPYLILAGDTGRLVDYDSYLAFIERHIEKFETIFLVLGNHEFYGITHAEGLELARRLEGEPSLQHKLVLLHQRAYRIPGSSVTILGCTLWSAVPESAREAVAGKVKDFAKIKDWTVDAHNGAHASDVAWLRAQVQPTFNDEACLSPSDQNGPLLVVTHHAPCVQHTSSPANAGNPWSSAFATDLLDEGEWDAVKVWVFGHTHFSTDFKKRGTRVISNQRGYVLPGSVESGGSGKRKSCFDVKRTFRI